MKIYKLILLLMVGNLFVGCEDYLAVSPSKTSALVPETVEQLESLLNNYGLFAPERAKEIIYGTDDFGLLTGLYDAQPSIYSTIVAKYATWDMANLANYDRPYWPQEWRKIFVANLILQKLDEVRGSEDKKKQLRAEAHFIRAYSYFQLANIFTLPYTDANKEELGLPIKVSTSFEESIERATLEATWTFMKEDLTKALELSTSLKKVNSYNRTWRASSAAVKAFAARFYLSLHNYEKAQQFAEDALAAHSELVDYNSEMRYSDLVSEVTIFNPNPQTVSIDYPYTHDNQTNPSDVLAWEESYYFRYLTNPMWYYIPSQELLDLYDNNYDLRYKYHIVEHYSYDRGAIDPPYDYPGYIFFFKDKILNGPSVSEMILIKAECQIRQGNWAAGIQTVNVLREVRMDANAPSDIKYLSATSQADALEKVLEERRREMPFISRWYDVRRYNNNDNPADNVIMTRHFYPISGAILGEEPPVQYKLEIGSRRFAYPLPITDIISSEGVLEQNNY